MTEGWESAARFLGLVFVDLLLAGDNAVVIALAARRLQGRLRRQAIWLGAGGAVALRLVLAAAITWLLHVPLLQALGGLLLLWIARKLVTDDRGGPEEVRAAGSVWEAVQTIILADVVMSLDNVLALVGVSGGHLGLLLAGLALSVPLIVWGSSLLSGLMDRWPWLVYAGAAILVWVAVEMVMDDRVVHQALAGVSEGVLLTAHVLVTLLLAGLLILEGVRSGEAPAPTGQASVGTGEAPVPAGKAPVPADEALKRTGAAAGDAPSEGRSGPAGRVDGTAPRGGSSSSGPSRADEPARGDTGSADGRPAAAGWRPAPAPADAAQPTAPPAHPVGDPTRPGAGPEET